MKNLENHEAKATQEPQGSRTALSAHTPGPWTVEPFSRVDKEITILEPRCMVDNDDVDPAEAAANARLIAAAPDLLIALDLLNRATAFIKFDRDRNIEFAEAKDAARAAIAKATEPPK